MVRLRHWKLDLIIFIIFFGFRCRAGNTSDESNITDIVKSLSKDYDNYVRPNHGGRNANRYLSTLLYLSFYLNTDIFHPNVSFLGPAVVVGISVYILSIHSLSEEKMVNHLSNIKISPLVKFIRSHRLYIYTNVWLMWQ